MKLSHISLKFSEKNWEGKSNRHRERSYGHFKKGNCKIDSERFEKKGKEEYVKKTEGERKWQNVFQIIRNKWKYKCSCHQGRSNFHFKI